ATAAGGVRTTNLRRGQRAPYGVDRVIVQLAKFFRRPAPVADVRLVPTLPVPCLDLGAAMFFEAMPGPLEDQFRPLPVIFRRISPTGVNLVISGAWRPPVLIRLGLGRKIFRHETNLDVRSHAAFKISTKDAVENRPVVNRIALSVLVVGARGTPLERWRAVAGGKKVVRAEVNTLGRKFTEFPNELPPILHVRVVRFVSTEKAPDGLQLAFGLRGVNVDSDRE